MPFKASSRNIRTSINGSKLIIEINVSADTIAYALPSQSLKTKVIATTGGTTSVELPDGQKMDLIINATIKRPKIDQPQHEKDSKNDTSLESV